jgi:signal transduction histidine kinase
VAYVDVTAILALTSRINLMLVVIILISILLCIILSRRFAKSFAEPVQKLSAFAGEIGSGKLSRQEFQFCDIEFDMLADSMNRMAEDLEKEKRKQEVFYQNVSHELRTPLTSIRGSAEGIVYDVLDAKSAAEVILAESDKLQHMVEDILYLSREGRVFPETEVEPLDLREVLSLCAFEQRLEAEKKGVSFVYDFAEEPLMISIQETHAQRLFGNLISNAIRYAEHQVRLCARAENETIFVSVADDGPGIPKEELPHVFDRFFTGKGGQHGIGLSIAKSAAGNYHGTILARNDGGCVFEVRLPMDPKIPVPDQES